MRAILGIALLAALLSIGRFTLISSRQLIHPVDVLNESLVLNTAILLDRGVNIYSRETYAAPPFNLSIYTPLYFAIVSSIPGFAHAPFITGRAVSLFFMICALCLLIFPYRSPERLALAVVGVGWLLLFSPFLINGALVRMDSTALFFSASAVAWLRENRPKATPVALAAFLAFLGVMTKQSAIAAPVACFLYLLWRRPQRAIRFALLFWAFTAASFFLLNEWSDGGFLWSILIAPQLHFDLDWFLINTRQTGTPAFNFLLFLSALACFFLVRVPLKSQQAEASQDVWRGRLSALYFLVSWLWVAVSIARVGSYPNHFIEPLFSSVWLLLAWTDTPQGKRAMQGRAFRYGFMILPAIFAWDAMVTRDGATLILPRLAPPKVYAKIRGEMESLGIPPSPKILNLVDHRIALSIGWDLHVNDTFWYAILWQDGTLSNRSIMKAIDQGYYDLVALEKGTKPTRFPDPTPLGQIRQKIFERYQWKADRTFAYFVRRQRKTNPP